MRGHLKLAILGLAAEPVEIGFLQVYPQVEGGDAVRGDRILRKSLCSVLFRFLIVRAAISVIRNTHSPTRHNRTKGMVKG